jgi:hypothetical protein
VNEWEEQVLIGQEYAEVIKAQGNAYPYLNLLEIMLSLNNGEHNMGTKFRMSVTLARASGIARVWPGYGHTPCQ